MRYQKRITTTDNTIEIFDDVFTPAEREFHLFFIQSCRYVLGSTSTKSISRSNKTFFQSQYNQDDLDEFRFLNLYSFSQVSRYLQSTKVDRAWVLASSPLSTYYYHPDFHYKEFNRKTLLYYANLNWDRNWGGETIFSNDCGEAEVVVEYKPGRIVIFDSTTEHKPGPISMEADEFRFTFVIQFDHR
jgi:Rps23 Pro-64 3,4-dihydroxylase Tpa1-like proline 4-hydroxylase